MDMKQNLWNEMTMEIKLKKMELERTYTKKLC